MQAAELIILWGSLGLAVYAYVVYPLLIVIASRLFGAKENVPEPSSARSFASPKVTLLIPARREESVIEERLRNAASLNYPTMKWKISS